MRNGRNVQVTCSRDLTSSGSFGSGVQQFKFSVPTGNKCLFSKCFLQYPTTLTVESGLPPSTYDGIGFAIDPIANCYQYCQFLHRGNVLMEVGTGGFVAQEEVYRKRKSISKSRIESVYNFEENFVASLEERINRVSYDGVKTQLELENDSLVNLHDNSGNYFIGTNAWELTTGGLLTFSVGVVPDVREIFLAGDVIELQIGATQRNSYIVASTPSATTIQLSANTAYVAVSPADSLNNNPIRRIRNKANENANTVDLLFSFGNMIDDDVMLPPGEYEIRLYPYTDYKTRMVQSKVPMTVGSGSNQFNVSIANVYLNIALVEDEVEDGLYEQVFEKFNTNLVDLQPTTNAQVLHFNLPSNTKAVTFFSQSGSVGSDTRYSASQFKLDNNIEKKITQFNIQYKAQNSNDPKEVCSFIESNQTGPVGGTDIRRQAWRKTMQNNASYYNNAGCEDLLTWGDYGTYFYHEFMEPEKNQDTKCDIYAQYTSVPTNAKMFVIAHTMQKIQLDVRGGEVVKSMVIDM